MSKTKVRSHLLQMVDSDSEDGLGGNAFEVARRAVAIQQSRSKTQKSTMPPAKRAATGRRAANRVTKPTPKAPASKRRAIDRIAAAAEEAIDGGKAASVEKPSNTKPSGRGRGRRRAATAEKEEEEEDTSMTDALAPTAETSPAVKKKGARGRPKKAIAIEAEPQTTNTRRGRKTGDKKAEAEVEEEVSEIPETQQPDDPQDDLDGGDDDRDDLADLPVHHSLDHAEPSRGSLPVPSSVSKRSPHKPSSDNGDPALRRRLGEMTQKYENLELKYRDLKEIAVREAERNFDRLKKQSEEKSRGRSHPSLVPTLKSPANSLFQPPTNLSQPSKPSWPHKKKPLKKPNASKNKSKPPNPKPPLFKPSSTN